MIDLNKNENELKISSLEEYIAAITRINENPNFSWNTQDGKKMLKLIDEICLYEKNNFDLINKGWINK